MGALVGAAERAVVLSGVDPRRARERAEVVLGEARARGVAEAVSIAHRALALAAREFGELTVAADHLTRAITAARDLPERAAQARLSLVTIRADLGDPEGALRIADLAEGDLTGLDHHRLGVQRSVALVRLGRCAEAVAHCDLAVEGLTGSGDARFLAGALVNRGIAHTYLGRYDEAARDLSACAALARRAGLDHLATLAQANLPFAAARRGDIPAAFAGYEAAERALAGYPERLAVMRADLAEALLAAHLPGEARALLALAVPELAAAEARGSLAESRLLLAELELLVGDPHQARTGAELAARELAVQGRRAWLPLAGEVVLRARLAVEVPDARSLDELRRLAARLTAEGWTGPAAGLRLTAAELALELGDTAAAEAELALIIADAPAGRAHRLIRQHAIALRHAHQGDRAGAVAALREGLADVTAAGQRLADPGVRAHAMRAGERLAEFGLSLAFADGRPESVLSWAEHCRSLTHPTPSPQHPAGGEWAVEKLGDVALVEVVRHGDRLAAVVVAAGRCVLRSLGSYTAAAEATIRLRYGLRRAGLRDTRAHDAAGVTGEAESLAARLVGPLAKDIGDRPVVIVPTGALHTLPWPVLPPFRGRALCVASSARAWQAADARRPGPHRHVAGVAGPGLRHADAEAAMVVRVHREAGREAVRVAATGGAVLEALGRAEVFHVAAHGTFRARSPLLSDITLDDGPLMAYDLLRLPRTPWLVVLSACDAGMAHAPVDGAPLGLAGAFLDRGTACVIAGLVPVRDEDALTLMTAFHALLTSGRSPAEALATATEKTGVHGFACFGSLGHPLH
ncbi:CHAT domain-containing protein [Sphaerisporangium siamense]|uniref:Tetratricopeptide (TPR) repeat protein n=1 Tax=Sphaerisporangium siamense TaxID=795645 RepID=A0A7W7D8E5_9ACTN|nr:CHAT domain-containing protein [Sphaerisporangium siamense]MBB4702147.1 tetratricopeptide (TPR) repeat protein [Sphaerisporangium siamense]